MFTLNHMTSVWVSLNAAVSNIQLALGHSSFSQIIPDFVMKNHRYHRHLMQVSLSKKKQRKH